MAKRDQIFYSLITEHNLLRFIFLKKKINRIFFRNVTIIFQTNRENTIKSYPDWVRVQIISKYFII